MLFRSLRTDSLYFLNTPIRVSQVFGFATAAVAIVLLIFLLPRKHDPAKLWVNQMKAHPRLVALVYPEGEGGSWLEKQKKLLAQDFARTEEYALPKGGDPQAVRELVQSLRERGDLSEVLVKGEKK